MPARDGQRVPNGAVVRTGRTGSVELLTRGRVVYVGHSAAVAVVNGAHQQLRTGAAVFDAQHGPGIRLDLAGDVVAIPDGSATEAMRSVTVEVGALAGPSQITSANARRLTVPPLAQAMINAAALPAGPALCTSTTGRRGAGRADAGQPTTPTEDLGGGYRRERRGYRERDRGRLDRSRPRPAEDRPAQRAGAADGDRRRHVGRQRSGSLQPRGQLAAGWRVMGCHRRAVVRPRRWRGDHAGLAGTRWADRPDRAP